MNIKQKLILVFLAISLIPMFIVGTLSFEKSQMALEEARLSELRSIADLKVKTLNEIMSNITKDLKVAQDYFNIKRNLPLMTQYAHDRKNPAYIQAKKALDSQLKTLQKIKNFEDIMLVSPERKIVYVTNGKHAALDIGQRLVDSKVFEQGKKGVYFSDILNVNNEYAAGANMLTDSGFEMIVAAPVLGLDGKFVGLIVFEVDMAPIFQLMQDSTGLGETGETLIGKNMGDYALFLNPTIYDPDAALKRKAIFGSPNAYPLQEAVQGRSNSGVSLDYRGEEILAVWRYVPSMNWGLVAKLNASEAFEPIRKLKNIFLIVGGIILVILVILAIFFAKSFSRPIQVLKEGIKIIGQGNLMHRVGTGRKDEIGQLARAFDQMTVNLQTATASREDFENEIATRKLAEEAMAEKNKEIAIRNRYEASYSKIVSFFSESFEQQEMLNNTLDVLANHHSFPASAIYLYDEWSGQLKLGADRGIPGTLQQSFKLGEGVIGQVIKDRQTIVLDEMDATRILSIDVGLLSFAPAALIAAPVQFQDRPLAVLVLASSKALLELDQIFVERLAAQLGVALNNLTQHQALSDLATQLKTHSEEIKQKNAQLEQANRMKSEFLANMSHELRTPLNAIIGFSEVLKDGIIGDLEAEQKDYVGDIFTSGKHLLSLINDILDLSKIEAGKMELELELVNVSDMLRNSISIIKEKAVAHRIKLDCDFGEALDTCFLDARKAKQIIYNLLSNAVKFTPDEGQVKLAVRRVVANALNEKYKDRPSPMSPPAAAAAEYLEITVSDTGIGISEADKKRLFTPFQQLESTLTKVYEGTGLGLVMLKRLAELHGGAVGMDSIEGEGSTFVVWLPYLVSQEQAQAVSVKSLEDKQAMTGAMAHHHTVLMVEDDEKTAKLMRVQLEDAGYAIRHAISAEQALDMLSDELPDLITLDIMLPGMDGWDLMQALKQRSDTARIPVVVVSMVADSGKGFSLGAADVLQKPVERQVLLNAIDGLDFSLADKRVLVVDDDPKAVELVSRHLTTVGCDVLKAYGGKEAIEIAKAEHPDLMILDLMMPKVSGFEVVETLKHIPELARIPIIILTAKVLSETDRRQLNGDIVKVMQKSSFNHGSFISEVNRAAHSVKRSDHRSDQNQGEDNRRPS